MTTLLPPNNPASQGDAKRLAGSSAGSGKRGPRRGSVRSAASLLAQGEPLVWLTGGALMLCLVMILLLLALVLGQGIGTFWPVPLVQVTTHDGRILAGEITRTNMYQPRPEAFDALPEAVAADWQQRIKSSEGYAQRQLFRTGNFDLTRTHFNWVSEFEIKETTIPAWMLVVERQAWGRFYGTPKAFMIDGQPVEQEPAAVWDQYEKHHGQVRARWEKRVSLETHDIGYINHAQEASAWMPVRSNLSMGWIRPRQSLPKLNTKRTMPGCRRISTGAGGDRCTEQGKQSLPDDTGHCRRQRIGDQPCGSGAGLPGQPAFDLG
ncbi:MAG: hypothetical protein HC898_01580 [Phycisphaerales bacterium]|nr:hypothetical protein [Phycisphaerales bacterium]